MDTPQPVDLNRLRGILGNAKAVMNKVVNNNYETGHVDARALNEDGVKELYNEGVQRPMSTSGPSIGYDEQTVMNSRLPEAVKKAMLERPIPQLTSPNYTFSLSDVADLSENKPMGYPKTPKTQQINESRHGSDMITISKSQLNEMVGNLVNEKLLEFFTKSYNKTITETTVKKTLDMLVKEGKLTTKKKI